jgi:hypothetical protein
MTTYETLSLVISILGSIGVIVSLWIWNRQTRIFNRQLMEGLSQSLTSHALEISRIFLQHPELRPYFFDGQVIEESHPDYLRAEAVAEVMLDIFWTMGNQARRVGTVGGKEFTDTEARDQWAMYMGDVFASSPILCSFLTKRKVWYGAEMARAMEHGLARARQQTL